MKKEYFSLQIRRYKEEMFLLSNSIVNNYHDAEDVVAETILTAYEKIHTLRDEEKFKSWLMQILVNNARKEIKKRNRYLFTDEIEKFLPQENEQTKKVWEFIFSLDEDLRVIVVLHYYQGFQVKEIAKMLHVPQGTVKSRLFRARNELKKLIEENEERVR